MNNLNFLNTKIEVNEYYFSNQAGRLVAFPKSVEYRGERIEFTASGLKHTVRIGAFSKEVYEMSDGLHEYQLEYVPITKEWKMTLVGDLLRLGSASLLAV